MARRRLAPPPEQLTLFSSPDVGEGLPPALPGDPPRAGPDVSPPATPITLQTAQERYHTFLLSLGRSRHTASTQRIDLSLLITCLGDRPVQSIDLGDLRSFIAWLRTVRGNDPRSLRRKVATVKGLFAFLHREGLIPGDPARQLVYPTVPPHLPEVLEPAEAAALVAAAADHPLWLALVLTLLDAGLKRDEVLALEVTDLVLEPAASDVAAVVVRATHEAHTLRPRRLRLSPRLRLALLSHLDSRATGSVFPVSVRAINFIVAECGRRAGVGKRGPVTPQMLRDTFAVHHMRGLIQAEAAVADRSPAEDRRAALREQHDRELLTLLGLAEDGDGAVRYRILASTLPEPRAAPAGP